MEREHMNSFKKSWKYGSLIAIVFVVQQTCVIIFLINLVMPIYCWIGQIIDVCT